MPTDRLALVWAYLLKTGATSVVGLVSVEDVLDFVKASHHTKALKNFGLPFIPS